MSASEETREVIGTFNDAFNTHDVDAIMALMTDDVQFDNTTPPDGESYKGQAAVRGFGSNCSRRIRVPGSIQRTCSSAEIDAQSRGGSRLTSPTPRAATCAASTCSAYAMARSLRNIRT